VSCKSKDLSNFRDGWGIYFGSSGKIRHIQPDLLWPGLWATIT